MVLASGARAPNVFSKAPNILGLLIVLSKLGLVHPELELLSLFLMLFKPEFLSSTELKRRYFEEC